MDINSCTLVGRVAKSPEYYKGEDGKGSMLKFRLAVGRGLSQRVIRENPNIQTVDYIDCAVWGKAADHHADYIRKGKELGVEGRLELNERDDNEGKRTWFTNIRVSRISYGADAGKNRQRQETSETTEQAAAPNAAAEALSALVGGNLPQEALAQLVSALGGAKQAASPAPAEAPKRRQPVRLDGPPKGREQAATVSSVDDNPFA